MSDCKLRWQFRPAPNNPTRGDADMPDVIDTLVMGKPIWMWAIFTGVVISLLVLDLGVLHRKTREINVKESLVMSAFYITIALLFGVWVWVSLGATAGENYFTGYLVEKTLSMDNVFVISLIFTYFAIPPKYQHRVLFWGILGAVVMRALMIFAGAALIAKFHWILYVFAAFLVVTGIKMLLASDTPTDIENNSILKFLRRNLAITPQLQGEHFTVRQPDPKTGKLTTFVTPLFVALIMIEFVDLIFAVDSIPAIFAITTDPFIVYTSNIFAILGLRALYFALAAVVDRFHYLKQALAIILIFIGGKVFVAEMMGVKVPAALSLGVTVALIAGGIVYSLYRTSKSQPATAR
jgi:tellurite resistance protein TerC